jgi:hypothetical protein
LLLITCDQAGRLSCARWERGARALGQQAEKGGRKGHHNEGSADQQQQEYDERARAEPTDAFHIAGRGNSGNEERHDERNYGHADGIDPQRAERRNRVGKTQECRVAGQGNDGAASNRDSRASKTRVLSFTSST